MARGTSTATTGGLANSLLATAELVGAVVLSVLAIVLPALMVSLVLARWALAWWIIQKLSAQARVRRPGNNFRAG